MGMHGGPTVPGGTRFVLNKVFDAPLDEDDLAELGYE